MNKLTLEVYKLVCSCCDLQVFIASIGWSKKREKKSVAKREGDGLLLLRFQPQSSNNNCTHNNNTHYKYTRETKMGVIAQANSSSLFSANVVLTRNNRLGRCVVVSHFRQDEAQYVVKKAGINSIL